MSIKEVLRSSQILVGPLTDSDITQLDSILLQHVKDRNTGEIVYSEIEAIKGYMKGESDEYGRVRHYLVARLPDGTVLGCMAYSVPDPDMIAHFQADPDTSSELLNAFVMEDVFRGGGVGRKLFDAVCQMVTSEGKNQLLVHSGPRYKKSWGFYDRMCDESDGFIIGKYGKGGDAKTWRKSLKSL